MLTAFRRLRENAGATSDRNVVACFALVSSGRSALDGLRDLGFPIRSPVLKAGIYLSTRFQLI
jgi:hypothetical protein